MVQRYGGKYARWLTPGLGLLLLIAACALFLRGVGFFDPWSDNAPGYNGAYNSLIARNYVRYGYWQLKLAQVWEGGPINDSSYIYYNHPPLVPLLVSFSFKLFHTDREWSARLVPLLFSLASLFLLYRLVRKVWTERVALLACFIVAVLPMASFYGTNVCYDPIWIFSFLLVLYFYLGYLERPGARNLTLMLLGLLLGALNDWPIFYAVPLLGAHYLLFVKDRKRSFLIFPLFAGLLFVLVASQVIKGGSVSYISNILYAYVTDTDTSWLGSEPIRIRDWLGIVLSYHMELYTLPILILCLVWLAGLAVKILRKADLTKDAFIVILLLFGLINITLGWQRAMDPEHAFWASPFIPGLAVAAAVVLDKVYERFSVPSKRSLYLKGLFYILLLVFAVHCTRRLYSLHHANTYGYYKSGITIKETSDFNELIYVSQANDSPVLAFYADRNVRSGVTDPLGFCQVFYDKPEEAKRMRHFFMYKEDAALYPELHQFLDTAFSREGYNGFYTFDLKSKKITDGEIAKYLAATMKRYNLFWADMETAEDARENGLRNFDYTAFSIEGEARRVLVLAPDSSVTFQPIPIRDGAMLKIGMGIAESLWEEEGNRTQFKVIVHSGDQDHALLSKSMDPKNNLEDRGWQEEWIDLSAFQDQEIRITLAINGGANMEGATGGAGWSDVEIVYDQ